MLDIFYKKISRNPSRIILSFNYNSNEIIIRSYILKFYNYSNIKIYLIKQKWGYRFSIYFFLLVLNIIIGGKKKPSSGVYFYPLLPTQRPIVIRILLPVVYFIITSFAFLLSYVVPAYISKYMGVSSIFIYIILTILIYFNNKNLLSVTSSIQSETFFYISSPSF